MGCGLDPSVLPDERSPVFLQFLDCLSQLLLQFPDQFEYNEDLLVFIANHSTSGLFGNFLGNSEKERMLELSVHIFTRSIWDYILYKKEQFFVNRAYQRHDGPIWPSIAMHRFKLWERYWNRCTITAHPSSLGSIPWFDDW